MTPTTTMVDDSREEDSTTRRRVETPRSKETRRGYYGCSGDGNSRETGERNTTGKEE